MMIGYMRKIAPTVMWIVIVAFVGTIFFAWGMDFVRTESMGNYIGKIGDEKISLQVFMRDVDYEREQMRSNSQNGDISVEQDQMLPKQVWEREVSKTIHKNIFKEMGLEGSTEEVYEHLKKNPPEQLMNASEFMTDSQFDTSKYLQFLNSPQAYDNQGMVQLELYTKNMIIPMGKLQTLVESNSNPSKTELEVEYKAEKEKVLFEYVKVQPHKFVIDSTLLNEKILKDYYKAHTDSFVEEPQAELYFIKIPKKATSRDEAQYLNDLREIKKRVLKGESTFEEEAKIESDDEGSAQKGGELGWFSKGQMVPEFDSVAFSLKPKEISEPIKTAFGFHLVYVYEQEFSESPLSPVAKEKTVAPDKNVGKQKTISRVRAAHILKKFRPSVETIDSLEAVVESVRQKVLDKGFKQGVSEFAGLPLDSTGLFKKGSAIRGIGFLKGATQFAFGENPNKEEKISVSEKLENEQALFLMSVKRTTPKGLLAFEDVKDRIERVIHDSLQAKKALSYIESIRSKLTGKDSLAHYHKLDTVVLSGKTDSVSRKQYIPDVGYNNQVFAAAFSLPVGTISQIVKSEKDYFVVRPLWKRLVDTIPWGSEEIDRIRMQYKNQEQRNSYMNWYTSYRRTYTIKEEIDKYYN